MLEGGRIYPRLITHREVAKTMKEKLNGMQDVSLEWKPLSMTEEWREEIEHRTLRARVALVEHEAEEEMAKWRHIINSHKKHDRTTKRI